MQGGAGISKDLPPFCVAWGDNSICGLNVVGLRRAGYDGAVRLELRRLYHTLFRRRHGLREALDSIDTAGLTDAGRTLVEFIRASRRGIVVGRTRRGSEGPAT